MKLFTTHTRFLCRHLLPCTILLIGLLMLAPAVAAASDGNVTDDQEIVLVVGKSRVIRAPWPTVRVAVTDPKIADVQVLAPQQILLQAFKAGATDIILWGENGDDDIWQRTVRVKLDVDRFEGKLKSLFPDSQLKLAESDDVMIIRGLLRSTDEAEALEDCLAKTGLTYVNMTSIAGVQQVQLEVRVAEVSRRAVRAMGMNAFLADDNYFLGNRVGGSGGALVPSINAGVPSGTVISNNMDSAFAFAEDVVASPVITLFAGFPKSNLEVFLQALAENQYLRLLANPTLVALSGEQADFLAGGEFPIPVVQGNSSNNAVSIEYKQYGVRLLFKPIVLGDGSIRLTTTQEVSELTSTGSVTIQGFEVPALVMRKAETTLELNSGQTFAMAGLLQNTTSATTSRIPGLGDLPILGPLFRSVRYQQNETELVILITASLVEPISAGSPPPAPGFLHTPPSDWELYTKGRIAGKDIPTIDPKTRDWMEKLGLDELVGPGAWESFSEISLPPEVETEGEVIEQTDISDSDVEADDTADEQAVDTEPLAIKEDGEVDEQADDTASPDEMQKDDAIEPAKAGDPREDAKDQPPFHNL